MSLIQKIVTKNNFSNVEKEIAEYILAHSDNIKDMTIKDLAEATYTSNPAIIRFCRKVGTDGYKEFKINFVQELEKRRIDKIYVDYNYPFHMDESTSNILSNLANLSKSTVDVVYSNLDSKMIEKVATILLKSNNVYFYAVGDSQIRAMSFQNKLLKLNRPLLNASHLGEESIYSTHATPKDCGLFISYSASHKTHLYNAQILKRRGAPIIVITANEDSVLTKMADYKIIIPNLENDFDNIATFYSQISFEYILNVLYSVIYNFHYSESHKKKDQVSYYRNEYMKEKK